MQRRVYRHYGEETRSAWQARQNLPKRRIISHRRTEFIPLPSLFDANGTMQHNATQCNTFNGSCDLGPPFRRHRSPAKTIPMGGFCQTCPISILLSFFGHFPRRIVELTFTTRRVSLFATLEKLREKQGFPLLGVERVWKTEGGQEMGMSGPLCVTPGAPIGP